MGRHYIHTETRLPLKERVKQNVAAYLALAVASAGLALSIAAYFHRG